MISIQSRAARSTFVVALLTLAAASSPAAQGVGASTSGGGLTIIDSPPPVSVTPATSAFVSSVRERLQSRGCSNIDVRAAGDGVATVVPPAGFDPMTATNGQLSCYGFPARPTDPTLLANWVSTMGAIHSFVVPTTTEGQDMFRPAKRHRKARP